ncbi:MAG: endo-1,4-beta-xylanase [Bacteroidota bacterium]|nr:endo-1,4-beta-xylanase [Bacteroidota bacterium]
MCDKVVLYEKADFPVGVAVDIQKLKSEEHYRSLVISQFNRITPEKSMKASFIHPQKERFDFSETDYLIDFCQKNNKRLHGHTLVWDKENPRWMERFSGDKNDWEKLLKDHIQTIVYHCKGKIKSWDVLNEAFNDDGSLRENIWLKNIGESYIEKCFTYAAEADPQATFFYNDFDLESRPEKLDAVLKHFSALKSKGVRIDGIGMQMHISINSPYISDIDQAAMKLESNGFQVHYSEFDITLVRTGKLWMRGKHLLKIQGNRMKEIVAGYRKLNLKYRFGITMWGVSDADSWLTDKNGNDKPVLFNSRYQVKPAYCGFLEGLKE